MSVKILKFIILVVSFVIPVLTISAQDFNFLEIVEHLPLVVNVKDGAVLIPPVNIKKPPLKYEYDSKGSLISVTLANGSKIVIAYDKENRVNKIIGPGTKKTIISYPNESTRIVEQGKVKWTYEYSVDGKQLKIIDGLGNTTIKEFDEKGNLVVLTDPSGAKSNFSYDANGNPVSFINGLGKKMAFNYDNKNRLVEIQMPSGRKCYKAYDDNGNLTQFTDSSGAERKFLYDSSNKLLSVTNPKGNVVKLDYDSNGNPVKLINPLGETVTTEYDSLGRVVKVTDPEGAQYSFKHDLYNNVTGMTDALGNKKNLVYDEMGNLTKLNIGNKAMLDFKHDIHDRLTTAKDSLGNRINYVYDENDNLVSVTYPNGAVYNFEYDANNHCTVIKNPAGEITKYEYSPNGLLAKIIFPDNAEENFEYDKSGSLVSKTDMRGNKTSYIYDWDGNIVSITDSAGNITKYVYDDYGRLIKTQFSEGKELSYQYDKNGNISEITDDAGLTTKYLYDDVNRITGMISPNGNKTEYGYDSNGNIIKIKDQYGNVSSNKYIDTYIIGSQSPYSGESKYKYDSFGRLVSVSNKLGDVNTLTYDEIGRIIEAKDVLGHKKTYRYSPAGDKKTITNYNNNSYTYTYDPLFRVKSVLDALGNEYKISYDTVTNTKTVTGPLGKVLLRMKYNKYGDLIQETDTKGLITAYQYDSFGNLISIENPDKSVVKCEYDKFQRLIKTIFPAANDPGMPGDTTSAVLVPTCVGTSVDPKDRTLTDGNENEYTYDRYGNITELSGNEFKEIYKYDKYQRLVEVLSDNPKAVVKYEYDNYGRVIKLVYPSGMVLDYTYDSLNRLSEIRKGSTKFLFSYEPDGKLISIKYPNGTNVLYEYDPLSRIIKIEHKKADGGVVANILYNYDAEGNVINIKTKNLGEDVQGTYAYDKDNQLTSYLPFGLPSPLQGEGVRSTYNSNGNVSAIGNTEFSYDMLNRLTNVKLPDGKSVSYNYSPLGKRVWKDVRSTGEGRIYFIYDRDNIIAEIKDGKIITEYIHGPQVDQPLQMIKDKDEYFYHADKLGSIIALTDVKGDIAVKYNYDPWGNLLSPAGNIQNPFLFTGREYDTESGLYYMRNRFYSPKLGQFLTKDPKPIDLEDPLTLNPYMYAKNNPLRFTDPFGKQGTSPQLTSVGSSGGNETLPNAPTTQPIQTPEIRQPPQSAIPTQLPQKSPQTFMSAAPPREQMSALTWGKVYDKPQQSPDVGYPEIKNAPQDIGSGMARGLTKINQVIADKINDMQKDKALEQINRMLQSVPSNQTVPIVMVVQGREYPGTGIKIIDKVKIHRGDEPVDKLPEPSDYAKFTRIIHENMQGRGLTPEQAINLLNQMVNAQNQIKNILAQNQGSSAGQTVTGPRVTSVDSQTASAQSASTDIASTQQQAIDKVKQQTEALQQIQAQLQNLTNQYGRGPVGADWSQNVNTTLQQLQNQLGQMSRQETGGQPGGGGTDTGTADSSSCGSSSSGSSSSSSSGTSASTGSSSNPIERMGQYGSGQEGPGSASDLK